VEGKKAVKPLTIEDYATHVGYVDLGDRIANISKKTCKWTTLFPFVGQSVMLALCTSQM
jgi:hypothetical protein